MDRMRYAVTILPEHPWREAAPLWRAAEELGFDCALTYDHLVWSGLQESPWFAAVPTLAAAAGVTSRIALGTFVSSPNYRHPYTFARDVLTLHDLTGGRFVCGLGTGGTLDSGILGETLTTGERVARFHEFVPLLDRLLRADHVSAAGDRYAVRDARTLPAPVRAEVPFLIAANGPKSLRLAATYGQGWVTTGVGGDTLDDWFAGVRGLVGRLDGILADVVDSGARPADAGPLTRWLSLDSSPVFSLSSLDVWDEMVGRAADLGFTDVVTHWPRPDGPYAGRLEVLDQVADRIAG
jgi:alkanesulfonate monooxygenase SsuD/methylene tetrahydromethanopterin reductase-like flavin-dependent oxidoreductase (luciferase family)